MDYGYWSKAYQDYDPDPVDTTPTPYSRVLSYIYQAGVFAANYEVRPPCPYKRADFVDVWELGYNDGYEQLMREAGKDPYPMHTWEDLPI